MRSVPLQRRGLLATLLSVILLATAGLVGALALPAAGSPGPTAQEVAGTSGSIVWARDGQIWVMDGDGTDQRVLVPLSAAPSMTALRDPAVHPSGSLVTFEGSTDQNKVMTSGMCGLYPYQYPCWTYHYGFNGTGAYAYLDGETVRLSPDPAYCYNCSTLFSNPEPRADTEVTATYMHCQGYLHDSTYDCISNVTGTGTESYPTCDQVAEVAPNPVAPTQIVYVGCTDGSGHEAIVVSGPDGTGTRTLGCDDDSTPSEPAWSPDGTRVVVVEGGAEPGLLVYGATNNGCFSGEVTHALVAPTDVYFHGPRFTGDGRILFDAEDQLWSVPATCQGCVFPDDATQLTSSGVNSQPAWTSHDFAAPTTPTPTASPTSTSTSTATPSPSPTSTAPATTTPTTTTPPTPNPNPTTDTLAPVLDLGATATKQKVLKRRTVVLWVASDEAASVRARVAIKLPGKDPVASAKGSLPGDSVSKLKVRLSKKTAARIREALRKDRRVPARVKVVALDTSGNRSSASLKIRLVK